MYVPLHAHTTIGSIGDSTLKVKDYVKKAKNLNLNKIAITDHGSMAAMIEAYEYCKEASITAIVGMEAYIVENRLEKNAENLYKYNHLVLLAKNKEGVKNLLRIHNDAQINGFYGKPRTDLSILKQYGKNLIALSACVAGEIPQAILNKNLNKAINKINDYKKCFDEFYLEIQPGFFQDQIIVNNALVYLSKITNTELVATNDIHYLNSEDYVIHNLHIKSIRDIDNLNNIEQDLIYPDKCYYLMSEKELFDAFTRTKYVTDEVIKKAISNTNKIANQCDGEIEFNFQMPIYKGLPKNETENSYLTKICFKKLKNYEAYVTDPNKYVDRLSYELDTINQLGFSGYFLVVQDFLNYARNNNIAVGPGRGSVAGSLVAYLLNITVADPIKHNLMFERFLSANRKSLVDIDLDFSDTHKMKEYVINKYGKDHCALVGTFGNRKAKNAIRSAIRLLKQPLEIGDEICKAMPFSIIDENGEEVRDPSILQMLKFSSTLKNKQEKYKEIFQTAINIESFPISNGIHAAGIVISPDSLLDKLPLRVDKATGMYVSLITKKYIEKIACKYDFLSLATMSIVDKTIKDCKLNIDLNNDEFYQDKKVWQTIGTSYTTGMFQISSILYKKRMKRLKPKNLNQLADCLALIRGPCISAKTDETYMQITEGKKEIEKIDIRYDAITRNTNGICIYQEQIMKLGSAFGFTIDEAYSMMKALSKKNKNDIHNMKIIFENNAKKLNISDKICARLWQIFEDASKYSFNQSHALSYAIITYLSAWLKYYYPKEYMANLLTNAYINNKSDAKINEIVNEINRLNINFLSLDINKSNWEFTAENNGIRVGLCAVKALGEKAAREIEKIRPIKNFQQILDKSHEKKNPINKTRIIALIFSGGLDKLNDKQELLISLCQDRKEELKNKYTICKGCEVSLNDNLEVLEQKLLRANFLFSLTANLKPTSYQEKDINDIFEIEVKIEKVKLLTDKYNKQMAFVKLSGKDCDITGIIFSNVFSKINNKILKENNIIQAKIKKENNEKCIILDIKDVII